LQKIWCKISYWQEKALPLQPHLEKGLNARIKLSINQVEKFGCLQPL